MASALGLTDFAPADLGRPRINLQLGSAYLARQAKAHNGDLSQALAAYNAGGGNVTRWLQRFGDDPDLFVELVPFVETQTYLRIVYDNYRHYQLLYGSPSR